MTDQLYNTSKYAVIDTSIYMYTHMYRNIDIYLLSYILNNLCVYLGEMGKMWKLTAGSDICLPENMSSERKLCTRIWFSWLLKKPKLSNYGNGI